MLLSKLLLHILKPTRILHLPIHTTLNLTLSLSIKDLRNLLQTTSSRFWKEEIYEKDRNRKQNAEDNVVLPSEFLHGDRVAEVGDYQAAVVD